MKVISSMEVNGTKYVLTVGNVARLTGNFKDDMAVYSSTEESDDYVIARYGTKLTHRQTVEVGYEIPVENYRN